MKNKTDLGNGKSHLQLYTSKPIELLNAHKEKSNLNFFCFLMFIRIP